MINTYHLKNFIWVPLAEYFGKRPVFVIASLILFGSIIWAALSTSFTSLLASRALAGIGGSSTEALGAAIINVSYGLLFLILVLNQSGYLLPA